MATNQEVMQELLGKRDKINDAINNVINYEQQNSKWTASAKTAGLAEVTGLKAEDIHPDLSIIGAWDGSTS